MPWGYLPSLLMRRNKMFHDLNEIMKKKVISTSLMWFNYFSLIKNMSEINMQKFLNTLWEFTGVKEEKSNFIQKALKVYKVFKVKPLKAPRPDVPSKKTAYNLFCKDIRKIKKSCRVFLSPRQVQSYRRNGKRSKPARRR